MKKRMYGVLLAVILVLMCTACDKKKGNGFATTTPTAEPTAEPTGTVSDELPIYHVCGGEVILGDYSKLTKAAKGAEVSDAEVEEALQKELNQLLLEYPNYVRDESRNGTLVQNGDTVNIDYVGKLNGVAFDGGTATGYDLTIGKKTFIEDLENGLIGKTVGTTVDVEAKFPDDYTGSEELRGKTTVFTVTINYVGTKKEEADDDYIKRVSSLFYYSTYNTIDELRKEIRDYMQEQKDENYEDELYTSVIEQMVELSEFKTIVPEDVEFYENDMITYYKSYAEYYGKGIEEFAELYGFGSYDNMMQTIHKDAENYVKQYMVLQEVAKKENLIVTEEKYNEMIQKYLTSASYTSQADFEAAYGRDYLEYCMSNDMAFDFLVDKAKEVETPAPTPTPTDTPAPTETPAQ